MSDGVDYGNRVLPARPTVLGRRIWDFFDRHETGPAQADLATARTPWTGTPAGRASRAARHDRTEGIPPRMVSMWPHHTPPPATGPAARRRRATRVIADLAHLPGPPAPAPPAPGLADALAELAAAAHGRPPATQRRAAEATAAAHGLDADDLMATATAVGTLVARAAGPDPARSGRASLNALHGADIALALDTHLARTHLHRGRAFSDPDLPRLWTAANALTHAVPADVILTVPAANAGPIAALHPTRDDLLGWAGLHEALTELAAVVDAARAGRAWLAGATGSGGVDDVLLAVGVLDLTHPLPAAEAARDGAGGLGLADLRRLAGRLPAPAHPVDLTDAALKAHCDRCGYLLGTPDERTHRELVERHLPAALTARVRARLAGGDTTALTDALAALAPTDGELDGRVWRREPPRPGATQLRQLLGEASREALRRFAGFDVHPHPARATALLARYPERAARAGLRLTAAHLTTTPPTVGQHATNQPGSLYATTGPPDAGPPAGPPEPAPAAGEPAQAAAPPPAGPAL